MLKMVKEVIAVPFDLLVPSEEDSSDEKASKRIRVKSDCFRGSRTGMHHIYT